MVLAGCGGGSSAVPVDVPVSSGDIGALCARMEPALPAKVDDAERRETSPKTDRTAAWGDPAVVLRCGVDRPQALTSTAELTTVNGIDWLVETLDGGHRFTTANRAAYIEIVVPAAHDPQIGPLVDLAPAMQFIPPRPEFFPPPAATPKAKQTPKPKQTPPGTAKPKP